MGGFGVRSASRPRRGVGAWRWGKIDKAPGDGHAGRARRGPRADGRRPVDSSTAHRRYRRVSARFSTGPRVLTRESRPPIHHVLVHLFHLVVLLVLLVELLEERRLLAADHDGAAAPDVSSAAERWGDRGGRRCERHGHARHVGGSRAIDKVAFVSVTWSLPRGAALAARGSSARKSFFLGRHPLEQGAREAQISRWSARTRCCLRRCCAMR